MNRITRTLSPACLLLLLIPAAIVYGDRVNKHAQLVADFEKRVADYMKLRNQAASGLPQLKPTDSVEAIRTHEQQLAEKIRLSRAAAKPGDLFTLPISAEFRRLIKIATRGSDSAAIRRSLEHAEPVTVAVHVNGAYPSSVPLQSSPPTLLENLPTLPKELEYRVIGHDLILRDIGANLIVDFTRHALPYSHDRHEP